MAKRHFYGTLVFCLIAFAGFGQTVVQANRVIAKDSVRIGSKWIYFVVTDSTFTDVNHRQVASAKAIRDFVLANSGIGAVDSLAIAQDSILVGYSAGAEVTRCTIPFPAGYGGWVATADSGGTETVTDGETVTFAGGTGLSTVRSGTTITTNLDNTAVTPATYGSATQVAQSTYDAQGRATGAANVSILLPFSQVTGLSDSAGVWVSGSGTNLRHVKFTSANTIGDANLADVSYGAAVVNGTAFGLNPTASISLPAPFAGGTAYDVTNGTWRFSTASAWESPVRSSSSAGLGISTRLGYYDANGRLTNSANLTYDGTILTALADVQLGNTTSNNYVGIGTAPSSSALVHVKGVNNSGGRPRLLVGGTSTTGFDFFNSDQTYPTVLIHGGWEVSSTPPASLTQTWVTSPKIGQWSTIKAGQAGLLTAGQYQSLGAAYGNVGVIKTGSIDITNTTSIIGATGIADLKSSVVKMIDGGVTTKNFYSVGSLSVADATSATFPVNNLGVGTDVYQFGAVTISKGATNSNGVFENIGHYIYATGGNTGRVYGIYADAPSNQFTGDVGITGRYKDSSGNPGSTGDFLKSTGTGTAWAAFTLPEAARTFRLRNGASGTINVVEARDTVVIGAGLAQSTSGDVHTISTYQSFVHSYDALITLTGVTTTPDTIQPDSGTKSNDWSYSPVTYTYTYNGTTGRYYKVSVVAQFRSSNAGHDCYLDVYRNGTVTTARAATYVADVTLPISASSETVLLLTNGDTINVKVSSSEIAGEDFDVENYSLIIEQI